MYQTVGWWAAKAKDMPYGHEVPYRAEERIRKTKDKKGHKVPYKAEDAI
jgi:hypothetical protein